MPRMKEMNADEHVGQDDPVDMPTEPDAPAPARKKRTVESDIIDVYATDVVSEAFLNEPVTVMIHETADDNAEQIPAVWVNGRSQYFYRGQKQVVRRLFVAALASAKVTNYSQQVRIDQANGNVIQRMNPRSGLKYPFQVIEDRNPKGRAWLESVLAQP